MSNSNVGTGKLFENDKIIVWEVRLEPGQALPCHTHVHDYVWYAIEGTTLEVYDENDSYLHSFEAPTGAVFSLRVEGDELVSTTDSSNRVPVTHWAKNVGDGLFHEILVETKKS